MFVVAVVPEAGECSPFCGQSTLSTASAKTLGSVLVSSVNEDGRSEEVSESCPLRGWEKGGSDGDDDSGGGDGEVVF